MVKEKLLIVDDDEDLRTQMKWALGTDYEVYLAEDRKSAMNIMITEKPDVVTLDLGLPPNPAGVEEGFAILDQILDEYSNTKVIIITGRGEKEHALRAIEKGAYDFFYKPIELDELKIVLRRAFHIARLENEQIELKKRLSGDTFEFMTGTSQVMQDLFSMIRKISTTDAPVLIIGESGTGKELVACAVHRLGLRKDGPFIPINCSAIPENLIESELFGHEKGTFTGAHTQRKGRFEMADGGTLFLDEIGELPSLLQVKLLRFLQEKTIERIGGRQQIEVDTRILAATNRNLEEAIKNGTFREDLYYRIAGMTLNLPALRQRPQDIVPIVEQMLKKSPLAGRQLSAQALQCLQRHAWPGNVRELKNVIERSLIIQRDGPLKPSHLLRDNKMAHSYASQTNDDEEEILTFEDLEKKYIGLALKKYSGNYSQSAKALGISLSTFKRKLKAYNL